jgi:MFS family permease
MNESMENINIQQRKPAPSLMYRWLVLIFISLAMFGNYYIYDSIAPIADLLKSQLNYSDEQIGTLYSAYSVAAIIVLLLGGYIIDRFGTKNSTLVFAVICFIAAIVTALSPKFEIMVIGRVLLGLGAEPLIVAITTALAKWFKGKELSFAFGINLTIARLGSVAADNSPTWAGRYYENWQDPLFIAAMIGLSCVIGAFIYWTMENKAEKNYDLGEAAETDKLVFKDMFKFNASFWLIVGLCITFYSAIFPFRAFAIKYFQEAHGTTREFAGFLNSLLPTASMIATPLFGLLVDKVGNRSLFMAFGSFLLLPVYLLMAYTDVNLFIPIIMMGISFSLIPAVMWPSVAYIIDSRRLGTAYSVMTLIQQVGLAGMNWLIGYANDYSIAGPDNPEGYNLGMWIFSILGFFGLLFSALLRKVEKGPNGHGLEDARGKRGI